jgi:hypothetical protein
VKKIAVWLSGGAERKLGVSTQQNLTSPFASWTRAIAGLVRNMAVNIIKIRFKVLRSRNSRHFVNL